MSEECETNGSEVLDDQMLPCRVTYADARQVGNCIFLNIMMAIAEFKQKHASIATRVFVTTRPDIEVGETIVTVHENHSLDVLDNLHDPLQGFETLTLRSPTARLPLQICLN